jgi:spermidine synthase
VLLAFAPWLPRAGVKRLEFFMSAAKHLRHVSSIIFGSWPWRAAHLLMFLSGALALMYEILWMRRFASVFGAATPGVAATLAAMFLGLSIGSFAATKFVPRLQHLFRAYGLLEFGIGIGALMLEPLLRMYEHFYPALYRTFAGSPAAFVAAKTALAMFALFLPSACMGATLPVLGQALAATSRRLGVSVGPLYGANTIGAALGAWSIPAFWLLRFSARETYFVCVAGSLLIGTVAIFLQKYVPQSSPSADAPSRDPRASTGPSPSFRLLLFLAATSGFCFFCLQVYWSRMFAQVHHNSIYSFSVILAVLLAALGAAAMLAKVCLRRGANPVRLAGLVWLGAGALIFFTPVIFYSLTNGLSYLQGNWSFAYALRILWLALPTVLLPSLLGGMILPLLMELAGAIAEKPAGSVIGSLLAVNTAGSIAGSLAAAFLLPHYLGMWVTLALLGVAMIAVGEFAFLTSAFRKLWLRRAAIFLTLTLAWIFANPTALPRTTLRPVQGEKLLALTESSHGIVAVVEKGISRRMKLNNSYILGGTASTGDERMQAHLPLLLHPAPKRVAFLGLGTGITAGAALLHPAEDITAIEIVPEVIKMAGEHFSDANLTLLRSPRVRAVTEDARNFLSAHLNSFDVIIGDLFVPWHQGEASLYTADQFAAARRALAPDGIFCQWLPMFQLSEAEFNMIAATFLDIFPSTTLWRGDFSPNQPALALIGHSSPAPLKSELLESRIRQLKPDAANPTLIHPAGVWMFCVGPLNANDERFKLAKRNQQDQPWLELLGPKSHAGSAHGKAPLFVRRALNDYLTTVRAQPLADTPLSLWTDAEKAWRDSGFGIAEAALLLAAGQHQESRALMLRSIAALPSEIQKVLER